MNTRIQVEHPVTEMVYGVDLVKEQIRIAAGEPLGYAQQRSRSCAATRSSAASTPRIRDNNFAPQAGTLTKVVFPGGPGVRVDTHVFSGAVVPPYYDSMIAKIVAFGAYARSRDRAHGTRAARDGRRRREHDDRLLPRNLGDAAVPRRPLRHRFPARLLARRGRR